MQGTIIKQVLDIMKLLQICQAGSVQYKLLEFDVMGITPYDVEQVIPVFGNMII
ncbi:Hypothetical protein MVR_LOCUS27 [uncultured virus]|nr:Hypothetical protein MVR_LOCUS27 [uncultured virus]